MFDNIQCWGSCWFCFLDEPYNGYLVAYHGSGTFSITGAEGHWS